MSIAGGLAKAVERGEPLKCEAIQIFIQSSRTWKSSPLKEEDIADYKQAIKKAKTVKRVVAHNSYLLNISTPDTALRKKAVRLYIDIYEKCEALGIESLITHPGSHVGAGVEKGIAFTSKSLDEVLSACSGFRSQLLLENTAGQGDCLGHDFEQLKRIVESTRSPDVIGFCFDTQHAFAAGYDLRTPTCYEKAMKEWNRLLSTKKIKVIHLNDSLKEFHSRVDRHENIGKGYLGKEAFRSIVNDNRFKSVPMCLETTPGEENVNYKQDLRLLRSLIKANR